MIPGGIADKLGNRYEAKWLVCRFFDLFSGSAKWIEYEGLDRRFEGFEFCVSTSAGTQWHQTKRSSPKGNWTIGRLESEGILRAFKARLTTDPVTTCHFVSQDNAAELRILTEKARVSKDDTEFISNLAKEQQQNADALIKFWGAEYRTAFDWLRRCYVRTFPELDLEAYSEAIAGRFLWNEGASVFPALRDIAEQHFNRRVDQSTLLAAISTQGLLKVKDWSLDQNLEQRIERSTDSYLATYPSFGFGGEILERNATNEILRLITGEDVDLVLATGTAGVGKSGIVRSLIAKLREIDIPHLAFRVDHHLDCPTKEALGERLVSRKEGPATTLAGLSPGRRSILIIDQVDSVSEVSGRDGRVREVIFQLISDAYQLRNVVVVVVCRSFDLESDRRLKSLKEGKRAAQVEISLLQWDGEVKPILSGKGIDADRFTEPQKRLLELPVNLSIFLDIDEPDLAVDTRSDLHRRLIEAKQRKLATTLKPSWTTLEALTSMCSWMSDRQALNAPEHVLDRFGGAADFLRSEGIIASSGGRMNFFHESFFDHIFARSFVTSDRSLIELLLSGEQHLFRRTQVRQILDALRQNDPNRYVGELSAILQNSNIRFHIKLAVAQWLGTLDEPSTAELKIVSSIETEGDRFSQLFSRSALSGPGWFPILHSTGRIETWLESGTNTKIDRVLWWLSNVIEYHPDEIARLLRRWWSNDHKRAEYLGQWFGFLRGHVANDQLLQLCCDVIESSPSALFGTRGSDRLTMLLHTWGDNAPDKCAKLIQSIFVAWKILHPGLNPFARDDDPIIASHWLEELKRKAPRAFVLGTTDILHEAVEQVVAEGPTGANWYEFEHRTHTGHRFGFDEFLFAYIESLKAVAVSNAEIAIKVLSRLDPTKHGTFMHVHLETIQANPARFSSHLLGLLGSPLAFEAGWHGVDWLSAATACRNCLPFLDLETRLDVERIILRWNPEREFASRIVKRRSSKEDLRWSNTEISSYLNGTGYECWCILETIGESLLSSNARRRLDELKRKFAGSKVREPWSTEAHWVGPPIKRQSCERMQDRHWLRAINRYDGDKDRRYGNGFVEGGARELARELGEEAKRQPKRFANLLLRIPPSAHKSYAENILRGLTEAEDVNDESLKSAFRHAHELPGHLYGDELAQMVAKHPEIGEDSYVLNALVWYALNGEANENADAKLAERETVTIDGLIHRGGGLRILGANGARSWAWRALEMVVWQVPSSEEIVWQAVELAVDKEPLVGVRCAIMHPLSPLFNKDKPRFERALKQLLGMKAGAVAEFNPERLTPIVTHAGVHLMPYISYSLPALGRSIMEELVQSNDETKRLIGAWMVFVQSFKDSAFEHWADELGTQGPSHRVLFADVAGQAFTWADNADRAKVLLENFFFDEDKDVRHEAADAFRQLEPSEIDRHSELVMTFLTSPAYADNAFMLLYRIEESSCDVLQFVVEASRRAIEDITANGAKNGRRATDVHRLQDLIRREYVSSERKPEARQQLLNVIDLMLEREIGGTESIVTSHDRW